MSFGIKNETILFRKLKIYLKQKKTPEIQLKQPSSSRVKEYTFGCIWEEPAAFLLSEDFPLPE